MKLVLSLLLGDRARNVISAVIFLRVPEMFRVCTIDF